MSARPVRLSAVAGAVALLITVAACGDDDDAVSVDAPTTDGGGASETANTDGPDTGSEITTREDPATGAVLVDAAGMTLYTSEQEVDGTVRCVDECLGFWTPAEVSSDTPMVTDDLASQIGSVQRPDDRSWQATYDGIPLYAFSLDERPGDVTGDALADSFGGTEFVWHAAVVGTPRQSDAPTTSTTSGSDDLYGY